MVRITEELVRKRAEHNEGEIFSLEELSLHQQNIEKLENVDKWCKDLKILYLHNNLIPKVENLGRLKKLEYVNFTLNNVTKVENLEGCESLKKLDFTINFIAELTSVEILQENYNLRELYLTGNPCADYEGYREYVINAIPQLEILDGEKITKTQRILAMQKFNAIRRDIVEQQKRYIEKHQRDESSYDESFDEQPEKETSDYNDKEFWKQESKFTPESRVKIYKHVEKQKRKVNKNKVPEKKPRRLFTDDGRALNANEPQIDFEFNEDEDDNVYRLDLSIYRYMDSSLLEIDVQPTYIRVMVKGKIFQMCLPKEVCPSKCKAERSQTTGHLVIIMPKMGDFISSNVKKSRAKSKFGDSSQIGKDKLEVTPSILSSLDKIVLDETVSTNIPGITCPVATAFDDLDFVDNPDVPPLL